MGSAPVPLTALRSTEIQQALPFLARQEALGEATPDRFRSVRLLLMAQQQGQFKRWQRCLYYS